MPLCSTVCWFTCQWVFLCSVSERGIHARRDNLLYNFSLFINNRPIGLFGIIEDFNTQWLQNEFAGNIKNYRVGRLYQGQGFFKQGLAFAVSDLAYEEDIAKYAVGQYDVEEPSEGVTLKDLVPLQDFTRFIRDSSVETTPIEAWEQKMNMESFIRA